MVNISRIAIASLLYAATADAALLISSTGKGSKVPPTYGPSIVNYHQQQQKQQHNYRPSVMEAHQVTDEGTKTLSSVSDSKEASENLELAFQNYMSKSHEDKIRAVTDVEQAKNAEIQVLQSQIKAMSGNTAPATTTSSTISSESMDELTSKIEAYQKFMSSYIVKAQEEKYKAVKAAEAAIEKKYSEKLNAFMLNPAVKEEANGITAPKGPKLYQDRNTKIAAAAKAGKSRWGDAEVKNVSGGTAAVITPPPAAALKPTSATKTVTSEVLSTPPEVIEADHGLRADGGVGGLTLAERVAQGADAATALSNGAVAPAKALPIVNRFFESRNAYIARAEKAGKQYRWGEMEVKKAVEFTAAIAPGATSSYLDNLSNTAAEIQTVITPEVEAADHGLRADGGVGGPSLAERVNLGARLLKA